MELLQPLIQLGLTEKEAKLYLTLLEVGANPVSSISRKAGITRTTAYAALETLKEKGLVSTIEKGGIQQFAPVPPEKIEDYAKSCQQKAEKNLLDIKAIVPNLKSLTGDLVMAPKVIYYEGIEGIKSIYKDTIQVLKELPKKERLKHAYSSAPTINSAIRSILDEHIEARKEHQIHTKGIFPDSKESQTYKKDAKKNFAEVRIMPKKLGFKVESEIDIYGDKIAIMSLKPDRLHGVIIESPEIAETQRAIFELAWNSCK